MMRKFARYGRLLRCVPRLARSQRGGVHIEMAFILPVLLALVIGTMEFGRMFWLRNTLQFAVEEAGRFAMVNASATIDEITTFVRERAGQGASEMTVVVTPENVGGTNFVTIAASLQFQSIAVFWDSEPILLSGRSRVPRES